MSVPMLGKIRLGIIGLGPLWKGRYRPALLDATDRFRITALLDQVHRRAEIEALALRARAVSSLAGLMAQPDLDAVALVDPQWSGLHALTVASRVGKPALVVGSLPTDPAELARLGAAIGPTGASTLVAGGEAAPAALRAFERLVRGEAPGPVGRTWPEALAEAQAASAGAAPIGVGPP